MSFAEWPGFCPICQQQTIFRAEGSWFRDQLLCQTCENGSLPRERALMLVMRNIAPAWREMNVHESSPVPRGVSLLLSRECASYVATQFFDDVTPGTVHNRWRCENLERQTFADEAFDMVVSQDVMEHVFRPDLVYQEIWRTLKRDGIYVHTMPIYKIAETECRAKRQADGSVSLLVEPEYHGNPIDDRGCLVTFHYGYDIADNIAKWAPFDVEIMRFNDRTHGIVGDFTEVIVCRKRRDART